jgi:hypothetical protein
MYPTETAPGIAARKSSDSGKISCCLRVLAGIVQRQKMLPLSLVETRA